MTDSTTTPQPAAELSRKADFGAETREVLVAPGGIPLTVHHPRGTTRGTVFLVPGWSGPRSGPADVLCFLAARLANDGWRAVRLDLPARGDFAGDFGAVDLDDMIGTVAAVVQGGHDTQASCHLLGLCSGGNVALGAAALLQAQRPLHVIGLSTLPFQPSRAENFERVRRWRKLKSYAGKLLSPNTWVRLVRREIDIERVRRNISDTEKPAAGERNLKDSERDIERELLGWPGRALLVWGGGDEEAPLARSHFENLHRQGMGDKKGARFETISGANHNFYSRQWREELARHVLGFMNA